MAVGHKHNHVSFHPLSNSGSLDYKAPSVTWLIILIPSWRSEHKEKVFRNTSHALRGRTTKSQVPVSRLGVNLVIGPLSSIHRLWFPNEEDSARLEGLWEVDRERVDEQPISVATMVRPRPSQGRKEAVCWPMERRVCTSQPRRQSEERKSMQGWCNIWIITAQLPCPMQYQVDCLSIPQ